MPMPKSVNIAGTDIDEIQGVNISINTPTGPRGDYEGRTTAATVQLYRRARNTPTIELFKNATNQDGRLNIVEGEIVLQNSLLQETYTIELKEAYISEWSFNQPDGDEMLYETVTLKVGKLTLSGGGSAKEFYLFEFNKQG